MNLLLVRENTWRDVLLKRRSRSGWLAREAIEVNSYELLKGTFVCS